MFKLLKALFASNSKSATPVQATSEMISAFDETGQELKIPRKEWHDKILGPNLRAHWNDPDALYQQILTAVEDGFAAEVLPAARHLLDIDTIPERAITTYGIVLMKDGHLDLARRMLEDGIRKLGRTSILLTNLAKILYEEGKHTLALDILWEAVRANPNLENGMMWWVSTEQERGGEQAYVAALQTVAALPGSWRAQLWLARYHLDRGEHDAAIDIYRDVLPQALHDHGALTMISGDLGSHGQSALMFDLVEGAYDPSAHGIFPGMNLLSAMHDAHRIDDGEALLDKLYALGLPPFKQHLDEFAKAFRQLRHAATPTHARA